MNLEDEYDAKLGEAYELALPHLKQHIEALVLYERNSLLKQIEHASNQDTHNIKANLSYLSGLQNKILSAGENYAE